MKITGSITYDIRFSFKLRGLGDAKEYYQEEGITKAEIEEILNEAIDNIAAWIVVPKVKIIKFDKYIRK